ncbi:MAG TPA: nitrous oxide reductase accessory protein NosL [Ignavibacteriaceae bacterium]
MKKIILFFSLMMLVISSCSKQPEQIAYGEDECEFCKMIVMDKRYGAELVTDKGKIYKFDSVECLVGYIDNKKLNEKDYSSVWVGNYSNPGNLIDASKAIYLKNDELRSPMGLNVLAVETQDQFDIIFEKDGGKKLVWKDLFPLVKEM